MGYERANGGWHLRPKTPTSRTMWAPSRCFPLSAFRGRFPLHLSPYPLPFVLHPIAENRSAMSIGASAFLGEGVAPVKVAELSVELVARRVGKFVVPNGNGV